MPIDVDWTGVETNAYRIYVPRADLTLVQASPEIRALDVDALRLELKDLEAAAEGMMWTDTHRHNTEVTVGSLTLARVVEILAPYVLEFEDGQYTVQATGANHNLADVKIANQVSLITQNSAGLISGQGLAADVASILAILRADVEHLEINGVNRARVIDRDTLQVLIEKEVTRTVDTNGDQDVILTEVP